MQKSFGPGLFSGPIDRNHSSPRSTMCGTQARVSTLFTMVGQPKRPCVAGNGGLMRG
jgi:hypothetical protein